MFYMFDFVLILWRDVYNNDILLFFFKKCKLRYLFDLKYKIVLLSFILWFIVDFIDIIM